MSDPLSSRKHHPLKELPLGGTLGWAAEGELRKPRARQRERERERESEGEREREERESLVPRHPSELEVRVLGFV